MKVSMLFISIVLTIPAFAAGRVDVIKANPEVKSVIAAFESNRSQKCVEITAENVKFGKNGSAKVQISCNQYDNNGQPQANVYFITLKGTLYGSSFELDRVDIE